jgi:transcriptional regulator with XRE-family HTH domain
MGDQSFARLIKRRRDALGFSQARLGELVGRSASTIRNWERGTSTPSERSDAVALAAVLGLDEREVLEGAGFDVEAARSHQTVEQGYASLAPEAPPAEAEGTEEEKEKAEQTEDPDLEAEGRAEPHEPLAGRFGEEPDTERDGEGEPLEETRPAVDEVTAGPAAEEKAPASNARPWTAPTDREPEPVDERPVSRPLPTPPPDEQASTPPPVEEPTSSRRLSRAAPPTVLEAAPPGEPSYLEDPQERQQYRIRAVATAVLVIGLVIVLMWAFGRASEAFSSLWDDFFNQLRI